MQDERTLLFAEAGALVPSQSADSRAGPVLQNLKVPEDEASQPCASASNPPRTLTELRATNTEQRGATEVSATKNSPGSFSGIVINFVEHKKS